LAQTVDLSAMLQISAIIVQKMRWRMGALGATTKTQKMNRSTASAEQYTTNSVSWDQRIQQFQIRTESRRCLHIKFVLAF
jgi:hypothetical protein